jgi:hypothetical protein
MTVTVGSNEYLAGCETSDDPMLGTGGPSVHPTIQPFREIFQRLASLARPLELPLPLRIYSIQGEKELVFCPFGIHLLLFGELFLSDQGFQSAYYGLAECSGQVKVCGIVTLGD